MSNFICAADHILEVVNKSIETPLVLNGGFFGIFLSLYAFPPKGACLMMVSNYMEIKM